ncbi:MULTISPECIES: PAS and ANTAR domain-containing protein [Nocardia]|uniref:PAS and ANTAR domain-containing protein n=1 Tax=Nocardia TaxID=1817 RepID=UPI000BEF5944|nr:MULTISPECIES: PAS and ANTAR domain-containing protein [Nocardia]MBF6184251.1 PAS and ANTAR domain-containing protein [Nocardia farcinica]MBF6247480.1 PAS and ANTAR domain-containing protein [Nocardia elegans]MBF6310095.1 PAS and ANTAR domain-containing protein [Nocardia farcinica]MBF6406083.1 PAS and ANTAR domain-containing protein [Nocardia farcinica]PEH75681.1 antitermination regulator [Nocardia sp. FDAARGOS_372]
MTESGSVSPGESGARDRVVGAGAPRDVGSFRFRFADQRWEWSDEVAAMRGYPPGSVVPTTELLLSHKHPEDREQVAATLARAIRDAAPFSSRHRIVDTAGRVRHVIVVADRMTDASGRPIGTAGYYIDVTGTLAAHRRETLDDTLPELYAARAVIEQAKGVLMFVYGIGAEQAFRVLSWRSQETNTKLRALAAQLLADIGAVPVPVGVRSHFDHLLLTAHERIGKR